MIEAKDIDTRYHSIRVCYKERSTIKICKISRPNC